jgi:hypothetical protein
MKPEVVVTGGPLNNNIPRKELLGFVAQQLESLQTHQLDQPIINVHGIAGIGKTCAVQQIYVRFAIEYDVMWLGFDPADIERMAEHKKSLDDVIAHFEHYPEHPDIDLPDQHASHHVLALTTPVRLDRPLLLLLDGLDSLSFWMWLQKNILYPFVENRRCLIICTSQAPLFWDYWELRERCQDFELLEFDEAETRMYLEKHDARNLVHLLETIYDYTQGYPLAVHSLVQQIINDDWCGGDPKEPIALDDRFCQREKDLLQYIGIMRLAESDVVWKLMARAEAQPMDSEPPLAWQRAEILKLWTKLRRDKYLISTRQGQPEKFATQLRSAVQHYLIDEQKNLERYHQICRMLADIYYEQADERPKTEVQACIEWLYFSTELPLTRAEDRIEWQTKLEYLMQRAADVNREVIQHQQPTTMFAADASLVVLFYRDKELIDKLETLSLLADVDRAMQIFLASIRRTAQETGCRESEQLIITEITKRPLRVAFDSSRGKVLQSLTQRLLVDYHNLPVAIQDRQNLMASIELFLIEPGEFDIDQLRSRIYKLAAMSPREINEFLRLIENLVSVANKVTSTRSVQANSAQAA